MADFDNGRLNSAINIDYEFNGSDNVSKTVRDIENQIEELKAKVEKSGKTLDSSIQTNLEKLKNLGSAYHAQGEVVEGYTSKIKQLRDEQEKYRQLANAGGPDAASFAQKMKDAKKVADDFASSGGLSALKKELEDIKKQFEETADSISKELEKIDKENSKKGSSGQDYSDSFLRRFGFSKDSAKNFKSNVSGMAKSLTGKGGLASAAKLAGGAIAGLAVALGAQAVRASIQLINNAIQKGFKALGDWVKSWGEFRRSLKEGFGNALTDAAKEIGHLDELNTRLQQAEKYSADYNAVKKEIVSTYGKYNKHLAEEIDSVGSLSSSYGTLTKAILASAMAKQRQKLIDEQYEKRAERVGKIAGRQGRRFSSDPETWEEWQNYALGLTDELSDAASARGGLRRANRIRRQYGKLNKKVERINLGFGLGQEIGPADYTDLQKDIEKRRQLLQKSLGIERQNVQQEFDLQAKRIAAMSDGYAKTIATINLNSQKELDALKKWRIEFEKEKEASAIAMWQTITGKDLSEFNPAWLKAAQDYIDGKIKSFQVPTQAIPLIPALRQSGTTAEEEMEKRAQAIKAQYAKQREEAAYANRQKIANTYGNEDDRFKALKESIEREIKELQNVEPKAAEARKKVLLAEFGYNEAMKWGQTDIIRQKLKEKLDAELGQIEEGYKNIKAAMNKVRLAEFDESATSQYGSLQERAAARANRIRKEANLWKGQNGGVINTATGLFEMPNKDDEARINGYVDFEVAKINWEDALNIGTYEEKVKYAEEYWKSAIKNMGRASKESILAPLLAQFDDAISKIAGIKRNLQVTEASLKGAFEGGLINKEEYDRFLSQARASAENEIRALNSKNDEAYKQIFSDIRGKSSSTIRDAAELARKEIEKLSKEGKASTKYVSDLIERVKELESAADELDFGGWGSGLEDTIKKFIELTRNIDDYEIKKQRYDSISASGGTKEDIKRAKKEMDDAKAISEASKRTLIKSASVTAANSFANALSRAAESMQIIAEVTGDKSLTELTQAVEVLGGFLSAAGEGAATGGWIGAAVGAATNLIGQITDGITGIIEQEAKAIVKARQYRDELRLINLTVKEGDYSNIFGFDERDYAIDSFDKMKEALNEYGEELDSYKGRLADLREGETTSWSRGAIFATAGLTSGYFAFFLQKTTKEYESAMAALKKGYDALEGMQIKTKDYNDFLNFFGIQDEYSSLKDLYPEMWDKNGEINLDILKHVLEAEEGLSAAQREQLQHLYDLRKAYEDARQSADKYISSLMNDAAESAAGKILDNFLQTGDALADMNDLAQDFARNLAKSEIQSRLMSEVFNTEAQETIKKLILSGNSDDLTKAVELYKQLMERAAEVGSNYTEFLNELGIEQDRTAQNAGFAAMSQDSADELNGRFAVLQTHTYDIRATVQGIQEQNNRLIEGTSLILLEVQGIHSDTNGIREGLDGVINDVGDLKRAVNKIADSGVRMLA